MNLEALGSAYQPRTFHGTQYMCDLGVADSSLCNRKSCGICSIIRSSFTTFAFGAANNSGRYGNGIYTYFNPAMADMFATSSPSSPFKAMLLCEVNIPGTRSNAQKSPVVVESVSPFGPYVGLQTGLTSPFPLLSLEMQIAYLFLQQRPSSRSF
jgi:hypothetical protein